MRARRDCERGGLGVRHQQEALVYASTKHSELFDAIVRASCTDGQENLGEMCSKLKEGEKSASPWRMEK